MRHSGSHWSFQYDRKPHFQKEGIKRREREGRMHQAHCFLILKVSSLTMGPKFTCDVLVSRFAESAYLRRVFWSWQPVFWVVSWHTLSTVFLATLFFLTTEMPVRYLSGPFRCWHVSECYRRVRKNSLGSGGKVIPWTSVLPLHFSLLETLKQLQSKVSLAKF